MPSSIRGFRNRFQPALNSWASRLADAKRRHSDVRLKVSHIVVGFVFGGMLATGLIVVHAHAAGERLLWPTSVSNIFRSGNAIKTSPSAVNLNPNPPAPPNFNAGDLAVLVAAASATNTTASVVEIDTTTAGQSAIQTITIPGTGTDAYRMSGSAASTGYVASSNDRTLLTFTGANVTGDTITNVNALNPRGVFTVNNAGTIVKQTTYTGTSGNQTRGASSINNTTWFIGDQGGFYSNGTSTASPTGNIRSLKSFGGTAYAFTASASAPPVGVISAATGGTYTGLPGLPNGTTNAQDFYLVSSGSNGSTYDVLYVLSASAGTSGTINKYSLVSGNWTANGSFTTGFGGFGLAAAKDGSGADLYISTGSGSTTANEVVKLIDTAGFNATIAIQTGSPVSITAATSNSSNIGTITTAANTFVVGQPVTISGMTPAGYNGTWLVTTVTDSTHFKVQMATNPGTGTAFGTAAGAGTGLYTTPAGTIIKGLDFAPVADTTSPVISYTALTDTISTANRTLLTTITDPGSGVPTSGTGLPVIYYRKGSSGAYSSNQCSFVSGSSYNCVIDYSLVSGGSVTTGDTIQYYVAAQDSAATPNVTTLPATGAAGFTANPPAAAAPPTTPGSYAIADGTPPTISYAALTDTTSTINRTLATTITDLGSGVPTSGTGLPVIYYRKGSSGAYSSNQCSFVSGSSYNCVIDYNLVSGGSVTTGDTIQYYVAAQDSAVTPNVTTNPATGAAGFTASPPVAATPPTTPNSYAITDTTPPTISYSTLADATDYSNRRLSTTITDAGSGVPTSGTGLPVIYYRKGASGAYAANPCSFVSGSNYNCIIDYTLVTGGSVTAGDVIQYYVAAQDSAATPNVTTNPATGASGFTANPPAAATPPTTPNSFVIAPIQITEYMYDGAGGLGEFVEFTNLGSAPVDMTGWSFDDSSRAPGSQSLSAFGTVQPGESVVFTESSATTFRTEWSLKSSVKVIGGNTNNLGRSDEINLYSNANQLIDRLTFGDVTFPGTIRTTLKSGWAPVDMLGPQTINTDWVLSVVNDAQNSRTSASGDIGNPGSYNTGAPGMLLIESGASTDVTEGGATDTYTVVLRSQPTADVTVTINPDAQVTTNPTTLTFTSVNWSVAQTVTVTAVDDSVVEGAHTGTISHTVTSTDGSYNGFSLGSVTANISDNDFATQPPTIQETTASTYINLPATGPGALSGVIGDPTDPGNTIGVDFAISDPDTPVNSLNVTAVSNNAAVVPNANLSLTGTGASRNLKITPVSVGYADITVTVSDGSNAASYVINYAASAASSTPSTTFFHTGTSDGSAAIAVDANFMFVADDENQGLRLYSRAHSGFSSYVLDPSPSLNLTDLANPEVDIEAATEVGSRIYWLGSHSNSANAGNARPNRYRLFATDVVGSGASAALTYVGRYDGLRTDLLNWDTNNVHGLGANHYGLAASAAIGVIPEAAGGTGFNIEGLVMAPGSTTTAYVCFRAPISPASSRTKALIVPVTNFDTLVSGNPSAGPAAFGAPIELDLGGRGIRDIAKNASDQYVIIGGPFADASGTPPSDFRLYTWTGIPSDVPVLRNVSLAGLNPEGIVEVPAGLNPSSTLQLISDGGDTVLYNDGTIAKDLPQPNFKKFRSDMITLGPAVPTASNGTISGTISNADGTPLEGVLVRLSGAQARKTITAANGTYHFENVETEAFYSVTPSRANYGFSPSNRSFSQLGNQTAAAFTATSAGDTANPLDTPEYFVRQQYVDILGREPDEAGFNYWSNRILACGSDSLCTSTRRQDVAAAFFVEEEMQQRGAFVQDVYAGALGRRPSFAEYLVDRQQVVAGSNLDARKELFAESFVQRPEFMQKYQANVLAESFVGALLQSVLNSSGLDLNEQRTSLVSIYSAGVGQNPSRARVLRALAENDRFQQAQYNSAFVLTEYFAYLQRDPDQAGYAFWVHVLNNSAAGDYRGLVCSFVTAAEYQRRFGPVATRSNSECGQ